jgi:hypothetical protein
MRNRNLKRKNLKKETVTQRILAAMEMETKKAMTLKNDQDFGFFVQQQQQVKST